MKIHSIQYLRGIAALMVVVFHLNIQLQRMHYGVQFPYWLSSGVDIFFVISGFIMWITTINRNMSGVEFILRRIVRIVPIYWTITTIFVLLMLALPKIFQSGKFDFSHVVASYFFFPHEHPVTHAMEPVIVQGWTLNYEMFFYILFACGFSVRKILASSD